MEGWLLGGVSVRAQEVGPELDEWDTALLLPWIRLETLCEEGH